MIIKTYRYNVNRLRLRKHRGRRQRMHFKKESFRTVELKTASRKIMK